MFSIVSLIRDVHGLHLHHTMYLYLSPFYDIDEIKQIDTDIS